MKTTLDRGVYAITPDTTDTQWLVQQVEIALQTGIACLQYRNKVATDAVAVRQAQTLRTLCRTYATPFIVNDNLQLAMTIDADGVHLGQGDTALSTARAMWSADKIFGVTCHANVELARMAKANGASYIAFGAMYPSKSKPGAALAPLSVLTDARTMGLPVVAIGGITPDNGAALVTAGADLLAAIDSIFLTGDTAGAVHAFRSCFH